MQPKIAADYRRIASGSDAPVVSGNLRLKILLRNSCSRRLPLTTGASLPEASLRVLNLIRGMMGLSFLVGASRTFNYKLPIANYKFPARLLNQSAPDTIVIPLMIASELK